MLQIRLNKGPSLDGGSGVKSLPAETVTVACPDHLVLADLPVAKGLGSPTCAARVKTVGRRSRRQLGERVHFCVRCDFPVAIYGRLTPCEHVFCLDCARSDSVCYLCDERIQKIQTIKLMEGIFICAAPHCLKSFLKKTEFEGHIQGRHANLVQPNMRKEEANNESDGSSVKPCAASESSSVRGPQKPGVPASPNPALRPLMQPRMAPPYYGNTASDVQNLEAAASDKPQQGILCDPPHYPPVYYPNFAVPGLMLPNRPPLFGFPPFPAEYIKYDSNSEGAPPGFSEPHANPWGAGPSTSTSTSTSSSSGVPFEAAAIVMQASSSSAVTPEAASSSSFFQGDYIGSNSSNNAAAADSMPPPPPGPPPPHLLQQNQDLYLSHHKRDGFAST